MPLILPGDVHWQVVPFSRETHSKPSLVGCGAECNAHSFKKISVAA
jgi:hypothetical protein